MKRHRGRAHVEPVGAKCSGEHTAHSTSPVQAGAWARVWPILLLAGVSFSYLIFGVDTALRDYFYGPFDFRQSALLSRPGAVLDYVATFLGRCDASVWSGALVGAGEAVLLYGLTRLFLKLSSGKDLAGLSFAPGSLWLVLQNFHGVPIHRLSIGLVLALAAVCVHRTTCRLPLTVRLVTGAVLAGLVFRLVGVIPAIVYAMAFGAVELRTQDLRMALYCWAAGLGVALLAWWFMGDISSELEPWGRGTPLLLVGALHVFFPLAGIVLASMRVDHSAFGLRWPAKICASPAAGGLLLGLAVVAGWLAIDWNERRTVQVSYFSRHERWSEALAAARKIPNPSPATRVDISRALFHTDRLGDELFWFRNWKGEALFPDTRTELAVYVPLSETLLELGEVNAAEHYAQEALEIVGARPHILKLLVEIYLAKGQPNAARVFLGRLQRDPFEAEWARQHLSALDIDPKSAGIEEVSRVQALLPRNDHPHQQLPTEALLQELLQSNQGNRMAHDFLIAHYLISFELEKAVRELARGAVPTGKAIPRHYEEALLLYQQSGNKGKLDLNGLPVRPETRERFQRLLAELKGNGGRPAGIEAKLERDYGDTYWLYYLSGESSARAAGAAQLRAGLP